MRKNRLHKWMKKAVTEEMIILAQNWISANVKDDNLYCELMVLLSQNETR